MAIFLIGFGSLRFVSNKMHGVTIHAAGTKSSTLKCTFAHFSKKKDKNRTVHETIQFKLQTLISTLYV